MVDKVGRKWLLKESSIKKRVRKNARQVDHGCRTDLGAVISNVIKKLKHSNRIL